MAYDYKKHFGEITLTQDLTTLPDERTWRLQAPERDAEPHQIVLYLGCNVLRTSHMIRTVTAIFDRLGLDYVAVGGPTYCCGIVHHRNGDTAASGGMNKRTVELFQRYKPEEVVMWCPSCMFFYDEIQKFEWPFPVRHTTEFLADRLPSMEFTHRVDASVALHYHSQSEPRLREGAAGRRLLEAVPGLRLVDVGSEPRFGRLCTVDVQAQAFDDSLAQVTVAEDLGYDAVWLAELHFQKERSVLSSPLVVGATIAGRTKRVKIGFAVQVLPLIHPLRLAEDVATLDQVSKGRLDFGVGRSGLPGHYTGFNIPYEESQERFDETLEILLGVDRGAVHVRGQVLPVPRCLRGPQTVPEAASAAPGRGDVRGIVCGRRTPGAADLPGGADLQHQRARALRRRVPRRLARRRPPRPRRGRRDPARLRRRHGSPPARGDP